MVSILFEAHSTTLDNEAHIASGHKDVELSTLGIKQSQELGQRYDNQDFDAIFVSDLQRSFKTAEIAFDRKFPIIKDKNLRECDYGDLTGQPAEEVDLQKINHITKPFPNGESYNQTTKRMKKFLEQLKKKYDGKRVMIIGHRATQYGLEHLIKGKSLEELVKLPFKWQPGWTYQLG